jgi:hypothetical protein
MRVPNTLDEAMEMRLRVFFLSTAAEAEELATSLVSAGVTVVSMFTETLKGASKPLHLVCVNHLKHERQR